MRDRLRPSGWGDNDDRKEAEAKDYPPGQVRAAVAVRWTAPDGQVVTHQVPVPSDTAVGGKLQVWTDRAGDLTTAPLLDSQVADQKTSGEALGAIAAAGVLHLGGGLVR